MRAPIGHARRLIATITMMAFVMASLGALPSPGTIARWLRVTVDRHPCEGHACGCGSVHDCWTNCCCHTPEERLAWAIREGVQPPAFVKYTQAQWIAAANNVKPGSATCGGCVAGVQSKLARGERAACGEGDAVAARPKSRGSHGAALSALGCKGNGSMLVFALPLAITAPDVVALLPLPRAVFVRALDWRLPVRAALDHPAPPPRSA